MKSTRNAVLVQDWLALLLAAFITTVSGSVAAAEEITFANDTAIYCPYTGCTGGKDGYVIDVVNAIYRSQGFTVRIINVPWNRALSMVNLGHVNGILGIVKSSAPNLIYPGSEIANYVPTVFSLKSNPWNFTDVESLKHVRLGLVQNYDNGDFDPEFARYLAQKPVNVTYISSDQPLVQLFKMIEANHIDATMDDGFVGEYVLQKAGKADLYKSVPFSGELAPGYVGFSNKNPKSQALADLFDKGLAKLRKSGELKTILAAYGLSDWKAVR